MENFTREEKNILFNSWHLVGHTCELKNENDFKVVKICKKSVLIFKFKNSIKAFTNVCSHRGSLLKINDSGNGKLICPYHHWTYNEKGLPYIIPYKKECEFKNNLSKLKLEEWKLEMSGDFIFISLSIKKNLKEYLGDTNFSDIKNKSYLIEKKVFGESQIWNSNWKTCVENSIDEYHAIFLHKTTFKKILKLKPEYKLKKNVMNASVKINESYLKKIKILKNYFKNLSEEYHHLLIFPLSTIATTMNHSFYIQRYMPINNNQTLINYDIYLPKINTKNNLKNFEKSFIKSSIEFNKAVFEEDKLICEKVQEGLKQRDFVQSIGKYEYRIKFFRNKINSFS